MNFLLFVMNVAPYVLKTDFSNERFSWPPGLVFQLVLYPIWWFQWGASVWRQQRLFCITKQDWNFQFLRMREINLDKVDQYG